MARPPRMCQVIRNVMPLPIALQIFDELTAIAARVLPPRHLVVLVIRASTLRRPGYPRALDFDFRSAKPEQACVSRPRSLSQPTAGCFVFAAQMRRCPVRRLQCCTAIAFGPRPWLLAPENSAKGLPAISAS